MGLDTANKAELDLFQWKMQQKEKARQASPRGP